MDNLELRQRITRSMIRVAERTQNMRRPEKFEVLALDKDRVIDIH